MDFKHIDTKYRPAPFWSWNEKLDVKETERQIRLMHEAGLGGFFMHARGGLQTEYMGKEWFDNISVGIDTAKELGMRPWAYDENGWPSGFGDGKVNGLGVKYQQKWLRYDTEKEGENTLLYADGVRYFYKVNPFYIDILYRDATRVFIEEVYAPYYEKYKNDIVGFFTDEPQISRNGLPWSDILPEEYMKAYNDDLIPHIPELFENKGDYKTTRVRFYKLITDLFSNNYMKQIYDWCTERSLALTGHMVQEETFKMQVTSSGSVMPNYEYFTIPGMDCLGKAIIYDLTSYQLGSAAQQLGKKLVMSESFAGCGHALTFEEMKRIYEHQMVHGINFLCQHLEGYSLRGIRKRDWPPALFAQQPWWDKYKIFCDTVSRTGMILGEGTPCPDTLVIHPSTTAWSLYNSKDSEGLDELDKSYIKLLNELDAKHIQFHLGDETIIERHGKVEGNRFVVGEMSYKRVILLDDLILFDSTRKLLNEYQANGGLVVRPCEVSAENYIVNNENIIYTKRIYDDFDIYYFVNHTSNAQTADISVSGKRIDAVSGDFLPFPNRYTFAPGESVILMCGKGEWVEEPVKLPALDLSGEWMIKDSTPNVLTLDRCDYWFDGVLQEKNGYVLNIMGRAINLKRPVNIKQLYRVDVKDVPKDAYFVCETPEIFAISVNGTKVDTTGEFDSIIDSAFKKIDVSDLLREGENEIEIVCNFAQSDEVYKNYEDSYAFETMKNKLTFDMEIEPCYLVGSFGVEVARASALPDGSYRIYAPFTITERRNKIELNDIQAQGFPFFAGRLTLTKEFDITDTDLCVRLAKPGICAIGVSVNGKAAGDIVWQPLECDISKHLVKGKNKIALTLYNTLRNMLGPHHLENGNVTYVNPPQFFKEACVWKKTDSTNWNDDYCIIETSVRN